MEFTVENLERAVSHFYQDLATQSQLNLWLTAAQSSAEAWTFSWQLLDQTKVNAGNVTFVSIVLIAFTFSQWKYSTLEPARCRLSCRGFGMKFMPITL